MQQDGCYFCKFSTNHFYTQLEDLWLDAEGGSYLKKRTMFTFQSFWSLWSIQLMHLCVFERTFLDWLPYWRTQTDASSGWCPDADSESRCVTVRCQVSHHPDWILEISSCFAVTFSPVLSYWIFVWMHGVLFSILILWDYRIAAAQLAFGGVVAWAIEARVLLAASAPNLRQAVESRWGIIRLYSTSLLRFSNICSVCSDHVQAMFLW